MGRQARMLVALVMTGLALGALTATAQAQTLSSGKIPTVSGHLSAATGITISKREWTENAGVYHCGGFSQIPDTISGSGSYFCVQPSNPLQTLDASLSFRYEIRSALDDGHYSVVGNAKVPMAGTSTAGCQIVLTGGGRVDDHAPYTCTAAWSGETASNDPGIEFDVRFKPTEVVTSADRQAALLGRLCGDSLPEGACRFVPSTLTEDVKAPAVRASDDFVNCTTNPGEYKKAWSHETSVSDTFGISVSGEIAFKTPIGKVTAGLELSYHHEWGRSDKESGEATITIDPGQAGAFWHAALYDLVTGDFTLVDQSAIYHFKDVRYAFPNRSKTPGTLTARAQPADCGPPKAPGAAGSDAACLPAGPSTVGPACVSPAPARVDAESCLTGGFTDGSCPPPSQLTDLDQPWPPSWASVDGHTFTHWDAVSPAAADADGSAVACPPGSATLDRGSAGARSDEAGQTQAWVTCTTTAATAGRALAFRSSAGAVAAPAAKARRTVYLSLPLGPKADRAPRDMAAAARRAFADHAASGLRLRVLSEADRRTGRPSARRARANARRAAADPTALAFVGGAQSDEAAAALPVLHRAGVLTVSPSSTALGLTTERRYRAGGRPTFARVVPNDFNQSAALARRIRGEGFGRVFVVRDGSTYGRDLARLFGVAARHRGLKVVDGGRMAEGSAGLARRVARAKVGAVLFAGEADNGALGLVRALARSAPRAAVYGGDGLAGNDAFLRAVHAAGVESSLRIVGTALSPDTLPKRGIDLYRRLTVALGHRPNAFAVNGYEAMDAVLSAIDRAKALRARPAAGRARTVRAFFATSGRRSPLGTYSIDRNGDTTLGAYGEFTVVGGELAATQCVGCTRTG